MTLRSPIVLVFALAVGLGALLVFRATQPWLTGPAPERDARTVEVQANLGWQGTGVRVNPGQQVSIRYLSGEWSPWPGGSYGPEGCPQPGCDRVTNLVTREADHAALIARVGFGPAILVNRGVTFRVDIPGEIFLRANDSVVDDNAGYLVVTVTSGP